LGKLGNVEEAPSHETSTEIKNKYAGQDSILVAKELLNKELAKEALALLW
jgi:hypothetical protein